MTPQSTKSLNACLLVVAVPFSCRSLHNAIVSFITCLEVLRRLAPEPCIRFQ
ncbi:hypothetical protein BIFPSEUDO_02742 [Bifidobacterium pseudocatenulatum DSM 20438 = JCM 1200 = LMG 10505]|uniref:Uncharacterized protein n=1 Tax=Bifidobacterium pseudocatenulatum DSM 20438 = JCM 1200 = LMG 10505 TaxID=547043 RepID=C0BQT9_BIFPS|nr:hypothetical protein BIFPSEUDO_02742 [Bifidobacterium pseudocatenulatum DSM 20438 = JCM 1200 = LMG 10505]